VRTGGEERRQVVLVREGGRLCPGGRCAHDVHRAVDDRLVGAHDAEE
jgi:hypothetical protein